MSAWWTKVGDEIKKHDGRRPKFCAAIHLNFAVNLSGATLESCGLYKRDPAKHPDEPNMFPAMVEKARRAAMTKQIRSIMKGGKRGRAAS